MKNQVKFSLEIDKPLTRIFGNLDPVCNPSWYGLIRNQNSTVTTAAAVGNGTVGVSSIVALIIFFGLIIYSAYVNGCLTEESINEYLNYLE